MEKRGILVGKNNNFGKLIRILYILKVRKIRFRELFCQYEKRTSLENKSGELGHGRRNHWNLLLLILLKLQGKREGY